MAQEAAFRALALVLAFATTACDGKEEEEAVAEAPDTPEPAPEGLPTREAILADADRRIVSDTITRAMTAPEAELRRTAALALARQHDPALSPLLRRALRDTDPGVRRAASLGLGAFEDQAPEGTDAALAGALAAETDADTRAAMIRDLGRLRTDAALAAVSPALRSEVAAERAAACLAVAERGLAGRNVPGEVRSRLGALIGPREPADVRLACAFALARVPVAVDPEEVRGTLVALGVAAADADPEVRAYVQRALGRHAGADLETIAHGTRDADWRVAVNAFRALAAQAPAHENGPAVYANALRGAHERATPEGAVAPGPPLHVLLTALDAAAPMARATPIHDLAERLHRQLGAVPENTPATRDRGLAHCAAAELMDRGRGWPSRVESCGLEQVLPWERQVREVAILGGLDGAVEQRMARLRRSMEADEPAVREAALTAAAAIVDPAATDLVIAHLADDDPGVRATALDALRTIAGRPPTAGVVPPPLPVDRVVAALGEARDATPDDELETLVTWLGVVETIDARALLDRVRPLALHSNHAVRTAARALLRRWEQDPPDGEPPLPGNPIAPEAIPDPSARPRVTLSTDRGELVLELRPDVAPTTVARFLELVRAGFYADLPFHRVVPGFVVQGGDPRGDGYGGPGWSQRCEDNRLPYRRGTVGMALAGRDTGGSQFFITHGAQPHLEGRYTAFGAVAAGLDVLDRLQPGDRIRSATAE